MRARINPFTNLRLRLGLLVLGSVGALAVFMSAYFSQRLTEIYRDSVQGHLTAIAATWDDGFALSDLDKPLALQRRIDRLERENPDLHKIAVVWRGQDGKARLLQGGHEHDRNGGARNVSTVGAPRLVSGREQLEAREPGYREVSAPDGTHYAQQDHPILRRGALAARLMLHYDLEALDESLGEDKRVTWAVAGLGAVLLALLLNLTFREAVFSPLNQLRRATQRIGGGDAGARLGWSRRDEIGAVARDFDRMAEQLQAAQAHFQSLALRDPLTDLLNHRAFQERMSQELRRAEREGYSVAVVALDVDHFKEINDRWGHAAGDEALRLLAKAIQAELRPSDICGRVGGDEFMLATVRSDVYEADRIVERLRCNLAALEVGPAGQTLTFSAGISEFPRHSLSREELMHLADGAMYWAKSSGRNRSFIYSSQSDFALSAQEAADRAATEGLINTVHALAKAVDAKDGYTHSHSQRVARYAAALAEALDMAAARVEMVRTAGVLHDVGKIGISDVLLLKPGTLTEEQFETMRRHSALGRDIIAGAGMHEIADLVLHLHERWDGNGYPGGLAREEIPLESRILHVADTLEAMTSSRVYRKALPLETALEELERHSGTQFDPLVAEVMLDLVRSGGLDMGAEESVDTGAQPVVRVNGSGASSGKPSPQTVNGNGHANGHGPDGVPVEELSFENEGAGARGPGRLADRLRQKGRGIRSKDAS